MDLFSRTKSLFKDDKDLFSRNRDSFSRNKDTFKNDRDLFTRNMNTFAEDRNLFTSQANIFSKNKNTFKDDANIFTALAQQGLRNEYWIKGRQQSPIDVTSSVVRDPGVRGLEIRYDGEQGARLFNTGSSVKIQTSSPHSSSQQTTEQILMTLGRDEELMDPSVRGGPLQNTYYLEQFHFHWGETEGRGGEHTIGGSMYDAELHFVHYNEKYMNFNGAVNQSDGLAVLAVLIQVGSSDHEGMKQITSLLPKVVPSGTSVPCTVNCQRLLPDRIDDYYTYPGSLTTPPYTESVTWVVFDSPICVSRDQIELFRGLKDQNGYSLVDNYREVQSSCGRVVKMSF